MKEYIVYKHQCIENGKVYIGCTSTKLEKRSNHGKGYKFNKDLWSDIQKYGWDEGFTHEVLMDDLDLESAQFIEWLNIRSYEATNPDKGYNRWVEDRRTHENICGCENNRTNKHSKTIYQYDLDGNFIREWISAAEVDRELKIKYSSLSMVLNGHRKQTGGYQWRFSKEESISPTYVGKFSPDFHKKERERKYNDVLLYDSNHNLIGRYKTVKEASQANGITRQAILRALSGETKTPRLNHQIVFWERTQNF